MSAATREQLLNVLAEFGECYPDWRFGQMVSNLSSWVNNESWADVDDGPLLAVTRRHLNKRFGNVSRKAEAISAASCSTRCELIQALKQLGSQTPDWQLARLVSRLAALAHVNVYDIEDEQLLETAQSNEPGLHWFDHYTVALQQRSTLCGPCEGVVYPCPCCPTSLWASAAVLKSVQFVSGKMMAKTRRMRTQFGVDLTAGSA